jgi:DNA-binding LacI/PurR family transcriptional regulator
VVGFDNSPPSVACTPQMSTVNQPVEEIVAAAVETLVGAGAETPGEQRFPTEVIVRGSSVS